MMLKVRLVVLCSLFLIYDYVGDLLAKFTDLLTLWVVEGELLAELFIDDLSAFKVCCWVKAPLFLGGIDTSPIGSFFSSLPPWLRR